MDSVPDVVVVGAGAAGLMAGIVAAERGRRTLILEKNRKPGVKILMSGGTRCNLTHDTDRQGIVAAFGRPGRFLHSALAALGPTELVRFFHAEGVRTKVEETGKVFPASDKALDVLAALLQRLGRTSAQLALAEPVLKIERVRPEHRQAAGTEDVEFQVHTAGRTILCRKVLLTTGGQSYPGCGTTGDGYRWVQELGHTLVPPCPALVPLESRDAWVTTLKGITLPDVQVGIRPVDAAETTSIAPPGGKRKAPGFLAERRSSLLFTHFGLSGPAAMDVSRAVARWTEPHRLQLVCDLLPDTPAGACSEQLARQFREEGRKQAVGILANLLPRRVAETVAELAGIPGERRAAEVSRAELERLVQQLKGLSIGIVGTLGFKKAEVTSGGVPLTEVDSRDMQSKCCPGLYLAGEILDLDGPIGGYNFQAAFSTGWLAGQNV